ncbi:YheC/YheD family endospore coat-associated protein [Vallitalea okinawensis]|uniref:YheC/YheD family endospore coat-associated protein n=1 Tax=Vallitalea okinawensis TaxID=2078660 RepID=UPI0013003A1B|nr:YheC/YheD family protein [Vallitalea okinawensis]
MIKTLTETYKNKLVVKIPMKLIENSFDTGCSRRIGRIKVGLSSWYVEFMPGTDDSTIEIPELLMKAIGLYDGFQCNANLEDETLSLGPVVGVFTSKKLIRKAKKQAITGKMVQYVQANKIGKTILYFFSVDDFDFINHKIYGTIFNEDLLKWERRLLPFPEILYDRGGSRAHKYRTVSRFIRKQFKMIDSLKSINPKFYFDKYDTYKQLAAYDEIQPYLPYTTKYKSPNDLKNMFKRSKVLYIKDRTGSNGKGVMRVEKKSKNHYQFSTSKKKGRDNTFDSFIKFEKAVSSFFKSKDLIIQTAIDLIKVNNTIVDMRATLQRNRYGELEIIAYAVRVAKPDSPVTSTVSGSNVYRFHDFFKKKMDWSDERIANYEKQIDEFLITIYKHIEKAYGTFGEIGIDFAIDTKNRLWFIESNAKPAKTTVHKLKDSDTLLKAYLTPLEYAKYLAGF